MPYTLNQMDEQLSLDPQVTWLSMPPTTMRQQPGSTVDCEKSLTITEYSIVVGGIPEQGILTPIWWWDNSTTIGQWNKVIKFQSDVSVGSTGQN